jgi:predicted nucleic acid-binding protein
MIIYLDASVLIKRYVKEVNSDLVEKWIADAQALSTGLISRAEISAALYRFCRLNFVDQAKRNQILDIFRSEWESFVRLPVTEISVERADRLACQYDLRGYDAVHLASACLWRETLARDVFLATFNRKLSQQGPSESLRVLPELGV